MKYLQFMPFAAAIAVALSVLGATLWLSEGAPPAQPYESPCVVSWDENDGDSTLCVLTREAAAKEHVYGKIQP